MMASAGVALERGWLWKGPHLTAQDDTSAGVQEELADFGYHSEIKFSPSAWS